jgi:hypothetical protein
MKFFLILIVLLFSNFLSAQNQEINNSINLIENDNQQLIAINNQQKPSNIQINFQTNKPSFDLPQLSKPQSEGLRASSRSSSTATSGVSAKSKLHKTIKRVSSKRVVKPLNKKIKIVHHFKNKNHIKRCASF